MTNDFGEAVNQTNAFKELETGMHFWRGGQWLESEAKIELLDDGAAATNGPHKVYFAANLNTVGAVDLTTSDGQRLRSRVYGLAYYDASNGKAVLLGETKDSIGVLVGDNQVLYTNAFEGAGIEADVQYFYTKGGLEQNIVLRTQPPAPSAFELNPATTFLQVLTEFYDPPVPDKTTTIRSGNVVDETLVFGSMTMARGRAFSVNVAGTNEVSVPVTKQWGVASGRTFLVEQVPIELIEKQIELLARKPQGASLNLRPTGEGSNVIAALAGVLRQHTAQASGGKMSLAQLGTHPQPGFVLDYPLQNATNMTLQGDTTYYVSGTVYLSGTNTIEGGSVIKYTNHASAKISLSGPLIFKTEAYRPAVFTSKDDNTVGDTIGGSTGSPTNLNGGTYLQSVETITNYQYLRMSYAGTAIYDFIGYPKDVWHCQFFRCTTAIRVDDDANIRLYNVLFSQSGTAVKIDTGGNYLAGEHITADQLNKFFDAPNCTGVLTNSILTAVTTIGTNVTLTSCTNNSSGSGIYQTNGAASYYLTNTSPCINAGTTNITAALASDLLTKTTQSPYEITTNISGTTILAPRVARDTNAPDLGYHYDPLDYVAKGRPVSANLTLTNGVALGTYGIGSSYGLALNSGSFVSEGTPTHLNWIVRYNTVQEQSTTNWSSSTVGAGIQHNSSSASILSRFTGWSVLAGVATHFYDISGSSSLSSFVHSRFGGGIFNVVASSTALTNNLWERVYVSLDDNVENDTWYLYNNLLFGGTLYYRARGSAPVLRAYDNLFDGTTITKGSAGEYFTHGYNGYVTNMTRLTPNGTNDVVLTNSPTYHTGTLGRFYFPTNDGMLSRLMDTGSRPADDAGFYHYTTHTNQVKETNSFLDIGYHYVAVTNGIPTDTDTDGIPDYLDSDSTPRTDIVWSNTVWYWKSDSLAWNCWTNALACTNGLMGNFSNMFTSSSITDTRNTNFWMRRFTGWPAYSVWADCCTNNHDLWPTNTARTSGQNLTTTSGAVMVSPEHFLTAGHEALPTNTWLAFMDMSNNVVFRQVKDYFYMSVYGGETTNNLSTNMPCSPICDYYIGLLDAPVPANIGFARVIPTNWWAWLDAPFHNNATNNTYYVPLWLQNCQHRTPVMKDLVSATCLNGFRYPTYDLLTLTNWNHNTIIGGDSGSPWFLVMDGELCLAQILSSHLIFGVVYETTAAAYVQAAVNATMRELSLRNGRTNIYSLIVKDLSKYPIYHPDYDCSP